MNSSTAQATSEASNARSVHLRTAGLRTRLAAAVAAGLLVRPFDRVDVRLPDAYWLVAPASSRPRRAVKTVSDWRRAQAALPA